MEGGEGTSPAERPFLVTVSGSPLSVISSGSFRHVP